MKTRWVRSKKANGILILVGLVFLGVFIVWDVQGELFIGTLVSWFGGVYANGHYQVIDHGLTYKLSPWEYWSNYSLCWLWTFLDVAWVLSLLLLISRGEIRKVPENEGK